MLVRQFLEKIASTNSLETAKAYADAALMVMDNTGKATLTLDAVKENQKIEVIKELRNQFSWGLKESKDFAESCPKVIGEFDTGEANRLAKALERAGAVVTIG